MVFVLFAHLFLLLSDNPLRDQALGILRFHDVDEQRAATTHAMCSIFNCVRCPWTVFQLNEAQASSERLSRERISKTTQK